MILNGVILTGLLLMELAQVYKLKKLLNSTSVSL